MRTLGKTHHPQQFHAALLGLRLRRAPQLHGRQRQVLEHREVREQVEGLEHHVHALAHGGDVHAGSGDVTAVEFDLAAARLLKAVEAAQEGALAATRGADDGNHLALGDLGVYTAQHLEGAEILDQSFYADHVRASAARRCMGSVRLSM